MSQVTIANPVTVVEVDATSSKVITQTAFGYYGSFLCTLGLDTTSTTVAYAVGYNTIVKANGVSIQNNNEITFAHPGVYRLDWHLQFRNTDHREVQLMLAVDNVAVDLYVFPAGTSPSSPVSPCTQLWVEQVGY
jgi:hypothetical protein